MATRKQTFEQDVKVCDVCPEPKQAYSIEYRLPNCYLCGLELCFEHTNRIGDLVFCPNHYKEIWKYIKGIKKSYEKPEETNPDKGGG